MSDAPRTSGNPNLDAIRSGVDRQPNYVVEVDRGLLTTLRLYWKIPAGILVVLVTVVLWWGFQPIHGGAGVGICRTFAEMRMRYPYTMSLTGVDGFHTSLRLFYTHIDEFGEDRSEVFECRFNPDLTLAGAMLNNEAIDQAKVDAFNRTIPGVLAGNPNTVIPPQPSDNIADLKP